MNIFTFVFRFVHVVGAICWGGGAIIMSVFVDPSVRATGEAGQKFAQHIINKMRAHIFMTVSAISTVLAGILLYWQDSNGLASPWMHSGAGLGFGIGAFFGLIAFISGAVYGNGNAQLGKIGSQIMGKPTEEQLAQIQSIQKRLKTVSPIHLTTMFLAMLCMATARYWFI